jgi:hypothetical protein
LKSLAVCSKTTSVLVFIPVTALTTWGVQCWLSPVAWKVGQEWFMVEKWAQGQCLNFSLFSTQNLS